ncbi:flagellar basal body-associated FliL family protein [Paenibacillus sp. N1-5-1-14]|uniref:flagellar basal body-associated FliL family protein n=1 Tax=Paenibacillus radicibacter TaxID=2972488 RepID=UPI0021590CA4|nr:flagellar basal body-associated FliL family protein [Paenibacillus radicibacter]MCR8642184.1 flagellar basal body-associated FliL family protein [Paenibacillus radicibacter]
MKNRLLSMVIIILISITLILVASFFIWNYMDKSSATETGVTTETKATKAPTPKEVKANTVIVKEIATNLMPITSVVRISLAFELENSKTKEDFENLLDSQVKGTIIRTLNDMTVDQLQGSKGNDNLVSALMNRLNPLLKRGTIKQISITDKVIQ